MTGTWSAESIAIGELARELGLLDRASWDELQSQGPPDDAEERAETDRAVGGTLIRVLIERNLLEMDDADRLLDELEKRPPPSTSGTDNGAGDDDDDASISDDLAAADDDGDDDDADGDGSGRAPISERSASVAEAARLDADEFAVDETTASAKGGGGAYRKSSDKHQTTSWLAGLAESGSSDRTQTSRVSAVSGSARLQIRPPSGRQSAASGASKATEPIRPQSGVRDPFTGSSTIGPYVLAEQLDRHGMAATFRARHAQTGEFGVLKVLVGATDQARVQRFLEDARSAAAIHHPQIATIQEYGSDGDRHYVATDLIEGIPVDDLAPPPGPRVAAQLMREVALAVHAGHGAGRVHGRLRPECIIVDATGTPHLTGFVFPGGQAGDDPNATDPPFHPYMLYASPELVRLDRSRVDARSDVFSLGAVLYRLLARRAPFETDVPAEYRRRVTSDEPTPPRSVRPEVPPPLELICLKAIARDPGRRYPTAADMAEDLERFLHGREVTARPAGMTQRLPAIAMPADSRRLRRRLIIAGVTAVAVLAVALVLWRGRDAGTGESNHSGTATTNGTDEPPVDPAEVAARRRQRAREALDSHGDVAGRIESATRPEQLAALVPVLQEVAALDDSWSRPQFLLGRVHDRLGHATLAVDHYRRSTTGDPRLPEADYRAVMRIAFSGADDSLATLQPHLDALLAVASGEGDAYPRLRAMQLVASATAEWLADVEADVRPALARARDLAPDLPDAWFVEGYVLGRVHPAGDQLVDRRGPINSGVRIYEAIHALESGLDPVDGEPLAAEPHAVIGVHELATDKYRDAEAELRRALAMRPAGWADVEYFLARALQQDGRLDEALAQMTALVERVTDVAEYWRYRGTLNIHAGNWDRANADLTAAWEINLDPTIQFLRGLVRTQIPDLEAAGRDFRAVTGDTRSRFKKDQESLRWLSADQLASLQRAIATAHNYFAQPPPIKEAIRSLENSRTPLGELAADVRERHWSPAMDELLDLLSGESSRAFRDGLRQVRETFGASRTGIYYELDEWLAPARLQRMLRDEEVMMQRTLVLPRRLYVRACVYFRRGRNVELALRDINDAFARVDSYSDPTHPFGHFDRARLHFAKSAILLALNDRDEQRHGTELVKAVRLDPVLTRFWQDDADYRKIQK